MSPAPYLSAKSLNLYCICSNIQSSLNYSKVSILFAHITKGTPKDESNSSFLAVKSMFSSIFSLLIIYLFF